MLAALAEDFPVPIEISVASTHLPAPVLAAAYFVCAEALANVAKHAAASRAAVSVTAGDGWIRVQVEDDGVGGADPGHGSGLRARRPCRDHRWNAPGGRCSRARDPSRRRDPPQRRRVMSAGRGCQRILVQTFVDHTNLSPASMGPIGRGRGCLVVDREGKGQDTANVWPVEHDAVAGNRVGPL